MQFDVFFSICQTPVDGYMPSEQTMFENFFSQVRLADELGYGTAWIAETHLSCEIQKQNEKPVIPHFQGEIGLNTDILQMAHKVFAQTKRINVGSAIRNILCNGGPLAHAEAIRTFLAIHGLDPKESRRLELGFAAGRFDFSNRPYGIRPRNEFESEFWSVTKGKLFRMATEIFLRALRGDVFSIADVEPSLVGEADFRKPEDWTRARGLLAKQGLQANAQGKFRLEPFWQFEKVQTIPKSVRSDLIRLTIGTHDMETQRFANQFSPVGVFNLSITPAAEIEATHQSMLKAYNPQGGAWSRDKMPRTVLVFLNNDPKLSPDEQRAAAKAQAASAIANYWKAMEGTLDQAKVDKAVYNALVGNVSDLREQITNRYNRDDRLMLWFDFNNHDNDAIRENMRLFMQEVARPLQEV